MASIQITNATACTEKIDVVLCHSIAVKGSYCVTAASVATGIHAASAAAITITVVTAVMVAASNDRPASVCSTDIPYPDHDNW